MSKDGESLDLANWSTQLRKGLLELGIINLLARGELYGYDLVKRLASVEGLVVTEGTVYPLLSRLRKAGLVRARLVESPSGPVRKYYTLTPEGRRVRETMNAHWAALNKGIGELVNTKEVQDG
jgi:PadR family transcriptional regulator, regulatory protein PadR